MNDQSGILAPMLTSSVDGLQEVRPAARVYLRERHKLPGGPQKPGTGDRWGRGRERRTAMSFGK